MAVYVLVHGSWLSAFCWDKIVPALEKCGHTVLAVDLPGHGDSQLPLKGQDIHTYSAYLADVLRTCAEPVILVGHSMGGMPISETAALVPEKVKKLVYLAAFLPKDGQACHSKDGSSAVEQVDWYAMAAADIGVVLSADQEAMFLEDRFACPALYNDLPESEGLEYCKKNGWEPIAAPYTNVRLNEAFDRIPKCYIKTLRDNILLPKLQEQMLAATPVDEIYEIDAGHSPYFSKPEEVTEILLKMA